jgi:hypothetical protein
VTALASEAGGPILGRTGEAVTCLSAGEKERGERGAGRQPAPFCGGSVVRQRGKGEGGPGVDAVWRGKWGRERGPRCRGGQLGWPASTHGRRARAATLWRDRGGQRTRVTRCTSDCQTGSGGNGAQWVAMGCGRE